MTRRVLDLLAFQICWFACVLGAAAGQSWIGPAVLVARFPACRFTGYRGGTTVVLLAATAVGTLLESVLVMTGVLAYRGWSPLPWLCPLWISALWANFGLSFETLTGFLRGRWAVAALAGGVLGPLAYEAGRRLGALSFPGSMARSLAILAVAWAVVVPLLVAIGEKRTGGEAHPSPAEAATGQNTESGG